MSPRLWSDMTYRPKRLDNPREIKSKKTKAAKIVTLTCGHELFFKQNAPSVKDKLWCFQCESYETRYRMQSAR